MRSDDPHVAGPLWKQIEGSLDGKYALKGWLGAGAFGDVFQASQTKTGQDVAIKVLHVREDRTSAERFKREIRACSALHHPHIVRVLDAGGGESSCPLYIVFEYVPGETLAQWIVREEIMRVEDALVCMLQVLDALHAAHGRGIVHRDLKPANIMVSPTALGLTTKVLDFGIASLIDHTGTGLTDRLTRTDDRIGTPAYCAPEQLRGEPPTPRVDIYAWGLVLLEAITGRAVFGGKSLHQVLHAQFSVDPVALPHPLEVHRLGELLRWTLEKDPARRASDAKQVIQQFSRLDIGAIVDSSGFLSTHQSALASTEVAQAPRVRGERRPATALCCLLSLSAEPGHDDDEAIDEWMFDLRELVAEIAGRFGGVLAGSAGSEMVMYFGLETREEASATRAARAALELRDLLLRRSNLMRARSGWSVEVRFGLSQGMVTIPLGGAPNASTLASLSIAASQLARAARDGEIAVNSATGEVLRGIMYLEHANRSGGAHWLSLLGGPPPTSNAEQDPLLGREAELAELDRIWRSASRGGARCVAVLGAAGIGKSHLLRSWTKRLSSVGVRVLACRCLPETQGVALQPVLTMLRQELELSGSDADALTKLEAFVAVAKLDPTVALPVLGAALSLSSPDWPELSVSPKKRRDLLLDVLAQILVHVCRTPAVLAIEDVHWADPTTLEWVSRLSSITYVHSFLVVATVRAGSSLAGELMELIGAVGNEKLQQWLDGASTARLQVGPLTDDAARALVRSVSAETPFDDGVLTLLVQRGAGVPLFLLELARAGRMRDDFVPASVAELLSRRIDALARAKEVVQIAAIAVPDCSYEVLEELSQRGPDLLGDLNQLRANGVLTVDSDGRYVFTHALLRDSAYRSVPRRDRQRLHLAVARHLAKRDECTKEHRPWTFALHHYHGGELAEAVKYGEQAASVALMRFENHEALAYVRKLKGSIGALDEGGGWLRELADDAARSQMEMRLMSLEATALSMTLGWTDVHLDRLCHRAAALFKLVPSGTTVPLRWAILQFYVNRGLSRDEQGGDPVRPLITELLQIAEENEAHGFVRLGRMVLGAWQLFHGEISDSIDTLARIDRNDSAGEAWKHGLDAHIIGRCIQCLARWFAGDPNVWEDSHTAVRMADEAGHPGTSVLARLYQASLFHLMRDRAAARTVCGELLETCERLGIQGYPGYAVIILGWADRSPALPAQALAGLCAAGQRLTEAYYGSIVAESELEAGDLEVAWRRLGDLRTLIELTGERFALPDVLFLQARCAAQRGDRLEDQEALLRSSIECALSMGARGAATAIADRHACEVAAGNMVGAAAGSSLAALLDAARSSPESSGRNSGIMNRGRSQSEPTPATG